MKKRDSVIRWSIQMTLLLGLFCLLSVPRMEAAGTEARGTETMSLSGGNRGNVPFPHWQHQTKIEDCNTCHAMFPRSRGSIEALKKDGALKRKAVMNKLCTKCHRDKRMAGEPSGPTSCNTCHVK